MQKNILILGAGLMQGPAIRAAKELGCTVVAVDGNPNAVCAGEADDFFNIDLKDTSSITNLAKDLKKERGLDAVFTAATDFSVAVSCAANACGLTGHTMEAAMCASDKTKMRECFFKCQVPSPKFAGIKKDDLKNGLNILTEKNICFPVVVKPADNMGARGCKLVYSEDMLIPALEEACSYSKTGTVIAEEFIDGDEFSLEALIVNGDIFVTAVADRHIFFPPHFVEMGHTIPSNFSKEDTQELISVFINGIKSLGLTNGAAKGDIFLKKADVSGKRHAFVGEIAARLSGGYMSGWTVPYSSGFDVTKAAIKIALGLYPEELGKSSRFLIVPTKENIGAIGKDSGFSAERAWISIPGKIKKIYGLEEAANILNVKNILPRCFEGDNVVFPKNNVEKCGNVLSAAASYKEAVSASQKAVQSIVIRLEPDNLCTCKFLNKINPDIKTQNNYEPNFFLFPDDFCKEGFKEVLENSSLLQEDGLVFLSCFKNYLDSVFDVHGFSIRAALQTAFRIEPALKQKLVEVSSFSEKAVFYWFAFIRASVQGLLYAFDSKI